MTRRQNKIIKIVYETIEEYMAERLNSEIGGNTVICEQGLSDEMRNSRLDLNFVVKSEHEIIEMRLVPTTIKVSSNNITFSFLVIICE
jgi:hypothetical protein